MVWRAIQLVDALVEVLDIVGVNNIHNYSNTQFVSLANERLQLLGRTKTRRRSKEVCHVVAKRAVVWVLGNSHNLNSVVASLLHTRQNIALKLLVGRHALLLGGHTDVRFVNQQIIFVYDQLILAPIERLRNPELRRVVLGRIVLDKTCGIGRDAVVPAVLSVNMQFI